MPLALDDLGTGAPVLAVLAILSLLSWTLIVGKAIGLWNCKSGAGLRREALDLWSSGDKTAARETIAPGKSPADRVTGQAMDMIANGYGRAALESEMVRLGNEEVSRMSSGLRLLELIAMVSPLLGLLGTVLGMIQSFQELELAQGAANASVLAGGIWQALLTTAAGLLVAIPAAVAAGLFASRIDGAAQLIESAAGQLMLHEDHPKP